MTLTSVHFASSFHFEKATLPASRNPLNFRVLNANHSRMAKDTNFISSVDDVRRPITALTLHTNQDVANLGEGMVD